jgi:hypothetical protein
MKSTFSCKQTALQYSIGSQRPDSSWTSTHLQFNLNADKNVQPFALDVLLFLLSLPTRAVWRRRPACQSPKFTNLPRSLPFLWTLVASSIMRGSHLRLLNLGLFLVAWTSALAAQDLSVPLSWRVCEINEPSQGFQLSLTLISIVATQLDA